MTYHLDRERERRYQEYLNRLYLRIHKLMDELRPGILAPVSAPKPNDGQTEDLQARKV